MSQHFSFMDCRGLSAPLTVLRIKQAMIGRADVSLPLEVVIDKTCCDGSRVAESLTNEPIDIRLFHVAESVAASPADTAFDTGTETGTETGERSAHA